MTNVHILKAVLVTKVNRKSEEAWLANVVEKGTMSDKLSAVQLKFQQAPVHSLGYLEKLITLFEKKKMRDSVNLFSEFNFYFYQNYLHV